MGVLEDQDPDPIPDPISCGNGVRHTPVLSIILDSHSRICDVSKSYLDRFNLETLNLIGRNVLEYFQADLKWHALETISSISEGPVWNVRAIPIIDDDDGGGGQSLLNIILELEEEARHQSPAEQSDQNWRFNTAEIFQALVETAKDYAIFMIDPRGNVRTWNLGAELMKGYRREEIAGRHFSTFYGLDERIAHKPSKELKWALRNGRVEDEGWRYRKDGSRFWANVVITPVYRNKELIGFSKVTRDLTERKAAEASLIAAYEESARRKSEFLANMSHEIRTPMHGMLAALNLLRDTKLNTEQAEHTNIIEDSGAVLLDVINNILDYSKITSGSFQILSETIHVANIINSVSGNTRATLPDSLEISADVAPNLPRAAEGDPLRYRQILQNLVDNAVKFTNEGKVAISASVEREDHDGFLFRTEVADTGIGIQEGVGDSLFTLSTELDGSARKNYEGTGLSLFICKSVTELMHGNIGYHPNPKGNGSVFWFTMEMRKLKQQHANAGREAGGKGDVDDDPDLWDLKKRFSSVDLNNREGGGEEAGNPRRSNSLCITGADPCAYLHYIASSKRILLAEDNTLNQKVTVQTLSSLGFSTIDIAWNGVEAVEFAREHGNSYDLIFMDISMPSLDGVTATARIRQLGVQTPIAAMTANALVEQRRTYLASGLNDYISKPVERKRLITLLLKWLRCG